jgi:hypothetical protein
MSQLKANGSDEIISDTHLFVEAITVSQTGWSEITAIIPRFSGPCILEFPVDFSHIAPEAVTLVA